MTSRAFDLGVRCCWVGARERIYYVIMLCYDIARAARFRKIDCASRAQRALEKFDVNSMASRAQRALERWHPMFRSRAQRALEKIDRARNHRITRAARFRKNRGHHARSAL